jgi:hypothetical protein
MFSVERLLFLCSDFVQVWSMLGLTEEQGPPVIIIDEANLLYSWASKYPDHLKVSGCPMDHERISA